MVAYGSVYTPTSICINSRVQRTNQLFYMNCSYIHTKLHMDIYWSDRRWFCILNNSFKPGLQLRADYMGTIDNGVRISKGVQSTWMKAGICECGLITMILFFYWYFCFNYLVSTKSIMYYWFDEIPTLIIPK
jgi:hypothetical protein